MDNVELEAQRHFPTVKLGASEIVVAEYTAASARCQADERAITITNGLLIGGTAAIIPVLVPSIDNLFALSTIREHLSLSLLVFLFGWAFVTSVISSYVCDLRRAFVFAARKVIVIRRMLGQSYGRFALVLPTWRFEGADDPLAIRLFPGWRLVEGYALYATVFLSSVVAWVAITVALSESMLGFSDSVGDATVFTALWAAYWIASIRYKLYDTHENFTLSLARILARLLSVKLHGNIHYLLYRAQLSQTEGHRVGLDFKLIGPIVIFREDRGFYTHQGVAIKSALRAMRDWARRKPSGGASTITQQLVRSLFIIDIRKQLRRKIVEIVLALWLEQKLTKTEILEMYITSVRYDKGVVGFIAARRHFFGNTKRALSAGEALVLVERVANIKGLFRGQSVERMLADAMDASVVSRQDAKKALALYDGLIQRGKVALDGSISPSTARENLGL